MAKTFYIGVDGKARKCKKAYIGIDGIARKIKKMYIGVAGIARCFFGGGELTYYGTTATPLESKKTEIKGASVGDYALFAGGSSANGHSVVDGYNSSLTKVDVPNIGFALGKCGAASIGDYAMFHGSYFSNWYGVYDSSLTKTNLNGTRQRSGVSGASNSLYAVFAGGGSNDFSGNAVNLVEAFDSSLTKTSTTISQRIDMASASSDKYAAFGSGSGQAAVTNANILLEVFDNSLTRTSAEYSIARSLSAGASVNGYLLFGGGSGNSSIVDAYDESLTRISAPNLSIGRYSLVGASVGDYAMFVGGINTVEQKVKETIDIYDSSLTRVENSLSLSTARHSIATTNVGDYALFAGGSSYPTGNVEHYDVVDVLVIN